MLKNFLVVLFCFENNKEGFSISSIFLLISLLSIISGFWRNSFSLSSNVVLIFFISVFSLRHEESSIFLFRFYLIKYILFMGDIKKNIIMKK